MEHFKPLRNYLRKFNLTSMLQAIWYLANHIEFHNDLPPYLREANPFGKWDWMQLRFFLWELDTLAREAILHCDIERGQEVNEWRYVRDALNKVKRTEEDALDIEEHSVFSEMSRIAHRQFHWQQGVTHPQLIRARKLYRHPEMDSVVRHIYGSSTEQVAQGGFAALATYMKYFAVEPRWFESAEKLLGNDIRPIIANLTSDYETLRKSAFETRSLNMNWAYTFNPLWLHPLISVENGNRIICPMPGLLSRRFTNGLYFDVAGHDVNVLSAHLGPAFQSYVGEVIKVAGAGEYQIIPEERYGPKKAQKDTVDWIVQDATASLFIEVKVLKMGVAAKTFLAPEEVVTREFKKMAKAIGQLYATLAEALKGEYPLWKNIGQPVYPLIVSMDNWNLFTHMVQGELDKLVIEELDRRGVDKALLETNRFTVCSIDEFEVAIQVMRQVGICQFIKGMTVGDKVGWLFSGYLRSEFSTELAKTIPLFPDEREKILPIRPAS